MIEDLAIRVYEVVKPWLPLIGLGVGLGFGFWIGWVAHKRPVQVIVEKPTRVESNGLTGRVQAILQPTINKAGK
jgi:hypothetical protein